MLKIANKLSKIGPRYGKRELLAAKIIIGELKKLDVPYKIESFKTAVPKIVKAELFADGISVPCIGSCLKSGKIKNGKNLINSLGNSNKKHPFNIAHNPLTDEISVVDFYNVPSVTISRKSVTQIRKAKNIQGIVKVKKEKFLAKNILVGNSKDPKNIIIAHYDSIIGNGAIDNAGSVAVLLETIKNNPKILENKLFVFAGNEEISYDNYKTKSGLGFRAFEKNHGKILSKAKQILVLDGVGIGEPKFVQTGLDWVLQVKMLKKIKKKVFWMQNDQKIVMKYFHSKADTIEKLDEKFLKKAETLLSKSLK